MKNVGRWGLALTIALLCMVVGFVGSAKATDAPVAEDISTQCEFISVPTRNATLLLDRKYTTNWTVKSEEVVLRITTPQDKPAGSLYLCFGEMPKSWGIQVRKDGRWQPMQQGDTRFLHAFVELPDAHEFRLVADCSNKKRLLLNELFVFGQGQVPDWVQRWEPTAEKADLLLIVAHPDDELIFMGGVTTTYAVERKKEVVIVYMTASNTTRSSELLNGLWHVGVRQYPVIGPFGDSYSASLVAAYRRWGKDESQAFVMDLIRKYKPDVVVTHDVNGEYGHGAHRACADLAKYCVENSMDPTVLPESAAAHGVWNVKKLYLHMYPKQELFLDLLQPLERAQGKTALQLAQEAYEMHVTQQGTNFVVTDKGERSNARFGLVYSTVGDDVLHNDMFENVDGPSAPQPLTSTDPSLAQSEGPAPTDAPTPEATPEPVVTPAPEVTPEPTPEATPEPVATLVPKATSKPTPAPTPEPTSEPAVTLVPEATQVPTPEPTSEPEVTLAPEATPTLEATTEPKAAPTPEATPDSVVTQVVKAESTPEVTATPDPTKEPSDAKPTRQPKHPSTPEPTLCPPRVYEPGALGAEWPTQAPERNEKGFLRQGEYVVTDEAAGLWFYASPTMIVRVDRKFDKPKVLTWYEAQIYVDLESGERFGSTLWNEKTPRKEHVQPAKIAKTMQVVFGMNTDYYSYRVGRNTTVGMVIRDRQVFFDAVPPRNWSRFPNLDSLAMFADGHWGVYYADEYTAQQYLDMGAVDVYSFGPYLVRDGVLNPYVQEMRLGKTSQPRCAIGMIEPGHYYGMLAEGGMRKISNGISIPDLAEHMRTAGCMQAINLDGGQTAVMLFMGEQITRIGQYSGGKTSPRATTELMGIGHSDQILPPEK